MHSVGPTLILQLYVLIDVCAEVPVGARSNVCMCLHGGMYIVQAVCLQ